MVTIVVVLLSTVGGVLHVRFAANVTMHFWPFLTKQMQIEQFGIKLFHVFSRTEIVVVDVF